ncbi:MAG: ATP-binding cassette domain-containing protein, partial [Oscillospiraceae bacterium]|nr:ATP-binding cassette domain-containing protein [Oscillospiraceae bacterium]
MEALTIRSFTFTYPERENPALMDINLSVRPGEFIVLCGPSGSGKTTLLRQLKPALAPHGRRSGEILFNGTPLEQLPPRDAAASIGFVQQNPENQAVTDKVWHELAFGLESLGLDTPAIRLRVAEMASFFGIQAWFHKNVAALSGGQKQLLSLASVMAMQPSLLLLDEPTSQLDPIAAAEFLAAVGKINRELGVTVLLTEHRLEEALPLCDRAVVLDAGRVLCEGTPQAVGEALRRAGHGMFLAMPAPMRIWSAVETALPCPVTVREGREWISQCTINNAQLTMTALHRTASPVVELQDAWFRYEKDAPDVLQGLDFAAYPGEVTAILGGNGTGKTTALLLLAGILKPQRGKALAQGRVGVLPQDPQTLFTGKTVEEDLLEMLAGPKADRRARMLGAARLCGVADLLQAHPYDLSGGEQQRAALAKVLLTEPEILLLDEPTKGFDAQFKQVFAGILRRLADAGAAIILVSHDVEFCAEYADVCALFFDGQIVTQGAPRAFFSGNSFYTSAANRMARHVLPEAVTAADVILALGGACEPPPNHRGPADTVRIAPLGEMPRSGRGGKIKQLSLARKLILGHCALGFLLTAVFMGLHFQGFSAFLSGGSEAVNAASDPADVWRYVGMILALAVEIIAFVFCLSYKREQRPFLPQPASRKLPRRTVAAAAMILLLIPLTLYMGIHLWGGRKYYFIGLLMIAEAMLPFALVFEKRRLQARELVVLAVLTALAVAGRSAFFMLPQFKPVAALVIIAGVAFGGEAGFLVGAMTGFVSNMLFGQGPWTPWQMFAFGLIGFLAGVMFKKGLLLRGRAALCVFGGLAVFVIYGGLLDGQSALMFLPNPTRAGVLAVYLQGI